MRSATDPEPEILRFDLNDLEENLVGAAKAMLQECRPGENHAQPPKSVNDVLITLKNADNEMTSAPWWFIVDPKQNFQTDAQGITNIAHMITGPFFCRGDADEFLKRTRYSFGPNAKVYCHSGTYSDKYRKLYNAAVGKEV
jgi:hypothetical protein